MSVQAGSHLDDPSRLATQVCDTPISLVTLVDGRRQVFKARHGFDADKDDLETGFCPLVVHRGTPVTIPDTLDNEAHANNRATREGGVRFYVGVPLAAFDRRGHRIGYGAGFYDRTLAFLRAEKEVAAIGLAYAAQEVLFVPADDHDEPLDMVVTEKDVIVCV